MDERRLLNAKERDKSVKDALLHEPTFRRLMAYARVQSYKTSHPAEELLNEAVRRIGDRERKTWWSDIPAHVFIAGVIRSIASEWYESGRRHEMEVPAAPPQNAAPFELAAMFSEITGEFADDPICVQIFVGMCENVEGRELMEECGLDPVAYATKRRRVRRTTSRYVERYYGRRR